MKYKVKNEVNILNKIEKFKNSKNPFSFLFIISDLNEIFINISEILVNSYYLSYNKKFKQEYLKIVEVYKNERIFESVYNYYFFGDGILNFKKCINKYFKESFFYDVNFFYYALSKNHIYKIIFDMIEIFYINNDFRYKYFNYSTYLEKKEFLESISEDFSNIKYDKDIFFIIRFLNSFSLFDFNQLNILYDNNIPTSFSIMKYITYQILSDTDKYNEIYNLFTELFILNDELDEFVLKLENNQIFDIINFLREEIILGLNYDYFILDFNFNKHIGEYLFLTLKISSLDLNEKIDFVLKKQSYINTLQNQYKGFFELTLKRNFLEKKIPELIDLIMGIDNLPQEVYYLFKSKEFNLDLNEIYVYSEIKEMIIFVSNTYFISFIKPFLIKKISGSFDKKNQKYYIIKFILSIILSSNYAEYKTIINFFNNVELFNKTDFFSFVLRLFQYGWIFILLVILMFFFPFGILLGVFIYIISNIIYKIFSYNFPKYNFLPNFQIGFFSTIIVIFSILFFSFFGKNINLNIIYDKYNYVINSLSFPIGESINYYYGKSNLLKTNLLEYNKK